jgi:hypothetical protein
MKPKSPRTLAFIRKKHPRLTAIFAAAAALITASVQAEEGWINLFDDAGLPQWRSVRSDDFPTKGWSFKDGVLTIRQKDGAESADGGDIITRKRHANFELEVDFKITPGANSGIKIFVQPDVSPVTGTGESAAVGSAIGLEFQILDDERHPDAKKGRDGNRTIGSLYDLLPAAKEKAVSAVGAWNHARIVSQGKKVQFWLNGTKVVEFTRGSDDFRRQVALSKYRNIPGYGEWTDGHILLQDHGNEVSFRNARIRELK